MYMVVSNFGSLTTIHAGLHPNADLDVATAARVERLLDVELDDRREADAIPHQAKDRCAQRVGEGVADPLSLASVTYEPPARAASSC